MLRFVFDYVVVKMDFIDFFGIFVVGVYFDVVELVIVREMWLGVLDSVIFLFFGFVFCFIFVIVYVNLYIIVVYFD